MKKSITMEVFFVFVLLILVFSVDVFSEKEIVSVGDIQYQCGENGEIIMTKTNFTKIRLPVHCQALYSVNTERTANCSNQQRCTLMTWKIIRELEMFLNEHYADTGNEGVIEFYNEMIIPGFNYLLHVTLKTSFGQIEDKDFNITFLEDSTNNESEKVLGNLELVIGSTIVYSSLPIILNTHVTLCGNISYYFFRWTIVTNMQGIVLTEKSSSITIISETIITDSEEPILIICEVINLDNNNTVLKNSIEITVIDPPESIINKIDVILPFTFTTINKGAPILITPYIYSPAITDENYKIEWICMFENTWLYGCQGQINKEFFMETGFSKCGNYTITLKVSNGELQNSSTCNLIIDQGVPSIDIDIEYPIGPEYGFIITAKIYEIRTYCTVQWTSDDENYLDLLNIPGFTREIYNISSTDKTFLSEIEEFGNVTATKTFQLVIPPQSSTWEGLESNFYNIKVIASCPLLAEINNLQELKETPEDFVTVSGQTVFFVPPLPSVELLEVFCENDDFRALESKYFYKIHPNNLTDGSIVYRYGFILLKYEVVFFSGIDLFFAETVMPFDGDSPVETYVEVCNYQNQCGKVFGPPIRTNIPRDLNESLIIKTFSQLMIEEDFYQAFSFAFIVLHSVSFIGQNEQYSLLFSLEISKKARELLEKDNENNVKVLKHFLENLTLFIHHLELSEEVVNQLELISEKLSTQSQSKSKVKRQVSSNLLSELSTARLDEIQNYLTISEYVILNSLNSDNTNKEKDHMLNLLERWMFEACHILYKGQRVPKIETKTMIFGIEKVSTKMLNELITIPFTTNIWNVTARLKINDLENNATRKLCLEKSMLKNFLNQETLVFGANIHSADDEDLETDILVQNEIYIPTDKDFQNNSKWIKSKNGLNINCSLKQQFTNYVSCLCPSFGYYFLDYNNSSAHLKPLNTSCDDYNNTDNKPDDYYGNIRLGQRISYVIILSSIMGFLIVCYIIKKLSVMPPPTIGLDGLHDNVQYGHVFHDDME